MPNKKKGASTNKKKNRGGGASRPSSAAAGLSQRNPNIPTFHRGSHSGTTGGGDYYEIYKTATRCFRDWMKQTLPNQRVQSVNDLKLGADAVLAHNTDLLTQPPPPAPMVVPPDALDALSTSIHYRERYTATNFGHVLGGDEGHLYMVGVLKYCSSVLRLSRQIARVVLYDQQQGTAAEENDDNKHDGIGGRFQALLLEEDEDEFEPVATDEQIRQRDLPTFDAPPPAQEDLDIEQQLINGDDRFQAMCLLDTMDSMMGAVDQHYALLKLSLRGPDRHMTSRPIQLLMECAAATKSRRQ